jgi:hypothetical protein
MPKYCTQNDEQTRRKVQEAQHPHRERDFLGLVASTQLHSETFTSINLAHMIVVLAKVFLNSSRISSIHLKKPLHSRMTHPIEVRLIIASSVCRALKRLSTRLTQLQTSFMAHTGANI